MSLALAPGDLADLPAVMEVMEAAFEPAYGEAWTASQCAGLLPLPGVWLTLARDGSTPVGFSLSRVVADEAELLLLAVHPAARRRGVGAALLQHFIAKAREKGAEQVHLEVRDGNSAIDLYYTAGFKIVGRRRNYYCGQGTCQFDALSLARPAAPLPK